MGPTAQGYSARSNLFSFETLPKIVFGDGAALFNWSTLNIYDVNGRLLFRDHTLDLDHGNEWRVRTAASDLLRTPVWSVQAGPALKVEVMVANALEELKKSTDLEPIIVAGEDNFRILCYAYPKLGILCKSRAEPVARFVLDIGNLTLLPLDTVEYQENPESLGAIWSEYDIVVRSTIAPFRWLWKRNLDLLPALPKTAEQMLATIRIASFSVLEEKETVPALRLISQETDKFCAAATGQMILERYGVRKSQDDLAQAMQIGPNGSTPKDQVDAINGLKGNPLFACLDTSTTFAEAQTEIRNNRPFKTGGPYHARAVGGFRAEIGGKNWLHIYDPEPTNEGKIYCENWDAHLHSNFMYVRALPFS